MSRLSHAGTAGFLLWGLLHVLGGGAILAGLAESPEAGFAFYRSADGPQSPLAGAILGYLSYLFVTLGLAAAAIAIFANRRNDPMGLAVNSLLVLAVEAGLIIFVLVPGHLAFTDALPGFILAAVGITFGGIACRGGHDATATR
ncbi:hypothetical protein [Frigidibacter sp. SD6-1]|uniref:hypothetical protein n=1 Tax=Frigidibacter sp. SD6-1 TaxID=3032581 RepID=UPI0024DF8985|nr:hypothetical protein [Frigidibacter sp. SD6-1]